MKTYKMAITIEQIFNMLNEYNSREYRLFWTIVAKKHVDPDSASGISLDVKQMYKIVDRHGYLVTCKNCEEPALAPENYGFHNMAVNKERTLRDLGWSIIDNVDICSECSQKILDLAERI